MPNNGNPKHHGNPKAPGNKQGNKQNKRNSMQYLSDPLTQHDAIHQAKVLARIQTQPLRRQLQAEQRAADQDQRNIRDYFKAYYPTIDKSADEAAAAYQQAQAQIGQTSQTVADYAEQERAKLAAEGRADAALRGATYTPANDQTDAAALLARANSAGVLSDVTAAQGASTAAHYADQSRNARRQAIEAHIQAMGRKRSLNDDLEALAQKQADLRAQSFQTIKGDERDFYLGQQAAALDTQNAKASRRNQRRLAQMYGQNDAASDQRAAALTREQANLSDRNNRRQHHRYGNQQQSNQGDGGVTGNELRRAAALLRQRTKPGWSRQRMIDTLINSGVSAQAARKAVDRALKRRLHDLASDVGQGIAGGIN